MSKSPTTGTTTLLRQGIAATKAGRPQEARRLLQQVVKIDPQNEMGWLWLSGLMTAREQRKICLEQVLLVNPNNTYARAGLRQLQNSYSSPPASVQTGPLASRMSAVIQPSPSPSRGASPSNQTKPVIKRLKSYQHSSRPGTDKTERAAQASPLEPPHSPNPTVPSPDLDPSSFETTCPACEHPISLADSQCPYCHMQFTTVEELLGSDLSKPPSAPTRPHRSHLRDVLGLLGTLISSRTLP